MNKLILILFLLTGCEVQFENNNPMQMIRERNPTIQIPEKEEKPFTLEIPPGSIFNPSEDPLDINFKDRLIDLNYIYHVQKVDKRIDEIESRSKNENQKRKIPN